jgi:hypothetical protein
MGWSLIIFSALAVLPLVTAAMYRYADTLPRENAAGYPLLYSVLVDMGDEWYRLPVYMDQGPRDAVRAYCDAGLASGLFALHSNCEGQLLHQVAMRLQKVAKRAEGTAAALFGNSTSGDDDGIPVLGALGVLYYAG